MTRLPLPAESELNPLQREVLAGIVAGKRGGARGPFAALLRSPELCRRAASLGEFLRFDTTLPPRLSEMAILMAGEFWQAQYEFFAHASLARKGGLPDDVIEALRKGERPAQMTAEEEAVFEFCAELLKKRRVSDATWKKAVAKFGEQGAMELVGLCGYYSLVSMVLNAAQVPLPEGEKLPFRE